MYIRRCVHSIIFGSPVYVADYANLKIAARRICWAKFSNAGQICINVDHVLCSKEVKVAFLSGAYKFNIINKYYINICSIIKNND